MKKETHVTSSVTVHARSPLSDLPIQMVDGQARVAALPLRWRDDLVAEVVTIKGDPERTERVLTPDLLFDAYHKAFQQHPADSFRQLTPEEEAEEERLWNRMRGFF
jgi:hypothetical protein